MRAIWSPIGFPTVYKFIVGWTLVTSGWSFERYNQADVLFQLACIGFVNVEIVQVVHSSLPSTTICCTGSIVENTEWPFWYGRLLLISNFFFLWLGKDK